MRTLAEPVSATLGTSDNNLDLLSDCDCADRAGAGRHFLVFCAGSEPVGRLGFHRPIPAPRRREFDADIATAVPKKYGVELQKPAGFEDPSDHQIDALVSAAVMCWFANRTSTWRRLTDERAAEHEGWIFGV